MLGDLSHSINLFSLMRYRYQVWIGGQVTIPKVMMHYLEVP